MSRKFKSLYSHLKELSFYKRKAFLHGLDLKLIQDNTHKIKESDILLISVMKNETFRLKFFTDYYRKLGVDHFIFVDNDSTDNFNSFIKDKDYISAFNTKASYKESNFGMHWANHLLYKYGQNHWCITCDPDEFLVYPFMETRNLKDLTSYLDSLGERAMFTVMIDMYSDKPIHETYYQEGDNPLNICPYFDPGTYSKHYDVRYKNMFIQGGVRQRVFFGDNPKNAPALNKVCLIKWKWNYAYVESMHMAIPRYLNQVLHQKNASAAMLHFKFISQLKEKAEEEMTAKQHWNNSSEYKKYKKTIEDNQILYDEKLSRKFSSWKDLLKLGFINIGEWS